MTDDAQSLSEQCGTSVHATEALLCNRQEQKIKQVRASAVSISIPLSRQYRGQIQKTKIICLIRVRPGAAATRIDGSDW
jgi:hypothetical protein